MWGPGPSGGYSDAGDPDVIRNTGGGPPATPTPPPDPTASRRAEYRSSASSRFELRPNGEGVMVFFLIDDLPFSESSYSQGLTVSMYDNVGGNVYALLGLGRLKSVEYYQFTLDRNAGVTEKLEGDFALHNALKQETNQLQSDRSVDEVEFTPNEEEIAYLQAVAGLLLMLVDAGVLEMSDVQPFIDVLVKIENGETTFSPDEMATLYSGLLTIESKLWHAQNDPTALAKDTESAQRQIDTLGN